MSVWITRSEPGASRLAARLEAAGYLPLTAPVMAIEPIAVSPPADPFDAAVFVSEQAVAPGLAALARAGVDPAEVQVFAVGPRTATVLREHGISARYPEPASSEGLLGLSELLEVSGRGVLLLCGEGGRDLLERELAARGAAVRRLELYRRRPVPLEDVQARVEPESVSAIVVGSGDGLHWAARVWFAAQGSKRVPLFVPSSRVAKIGEQLGFARVVVCEGAGSDALLAALSQLVE